MADENPKMDLDLIQMVQRARMINDEQAQPSEVNAVYWIEAKAPSGKPTPRAGKWVIPTSVDAVDALWGKIREATEQGELGYKSKVSTSPGKNQAHSDARLIHVRVADSDDKQDVARIKRALNALGISDKLEFVRD